MSNNNDISLKIKNIFDNNKLDDLKRFLSKRKCLNTTNSFLVYLFHIVQSVGILLTSYATGNNNTNLIWVGVSLNFLATLIHVFEQTNNSFLKKLMIDIKSIKDNNYIDEGELVETENNKNITTNSNNPLTPSMLENKSSEIILNNIEV
jgi:hypothetical protein